VTEQIDRSADGLIEERDEVLRKVRYRVPRRVMGIGRQAVASMIERHHRAISRQGVDLQGEVE
jgi:hypothetical protein